MLLTMQSPSQYSFVVGALHRRQIRRHMLAAGWSFREEKGWLDSLFVVSGDASRIQRAYRWVKSLEAELA
jgi:hypothetical protein